MINRRYLVKKKIGQGRSAVYLCEDTEQTGKKYAVKFLPANSSFEEQQIFKEEFQTIQKLDHPSIIQAYERGTVVEVTENEPISVGSKYLVMEYFDGTGLLAYPLEDESSLRAIITQICSVLFYLHQSRYIYYDLKPENILVNEENGKPKIKLIDLGFARQNTGQELGTITGTAEYLAPELLKKEFHDHRVDLYSFGILLYRLIYKKFPFDAEYQLEIYKAHIEKVFTFPNTKYSIEIIDVVKKLLSKKPEDRYFTSVQIFYDLQIPIEENIYRYWIPIKVFSDRTDVLNIVNRYVTMPSSGEIIIIKGFEKSGKSAVSRELYSRYENLILVDNDRTKSGLQFIKHFLNRLTYNDIVFPRLSDETLERINKIFNNQTENLVEELKLIVNKITLNDRLIVLLDDFNLYDSFIIEVFREIFPIFQVNGCNIILTEKSDLDYITDFINNSIVLNLSSFTAAQTDELLEKTYADFFPLNDVRHLIMLYADLLPGNIHEFLRDLVILKIIRFESDAIKVASDETAGKILANLYEEIYSIRHKSLNEDEVKVSSILSAFEITPERTMLIHLTSFSDNVLSKLVENLQHKHILQGQSSTGLNFSSDGIKNFIYLQIPNKRGLHEQIASIIHQNFPNFNRVELARQYQMCERYNDSYTLLMTEAEEAEKIAAFKYEQNILEQLLNIPLSDNQRFETKYRLCFLYSALNNYKSSLQLSEELLMEKISEDEESELLMIKGNSLIKLSEVEKGKLILDSLLPTIENEDRKVRAMLDIAGAELDLNNFNSVSRICNSILHNSSASSEKRGDAYNLLGLVNIHQDYELNYALSNFKNCLNEYEKAKSQKRIAAIEGNIGNIYNILGNYEKVEKHWNKSLEISSSLGNLNYQAQVLMNFGILHFNRQSFEKSVDNYKRANLIFNTLGDKVNQGKSETNLGEVYLFTSEYQKALDSLETAREIFHSIQNYLEESEACFLLAKVYWTIGDYELFNKLINEIKFLFETHNLSDRIKTHLDFLNCIKTYELEKELNDDNLIQIAKEYLSKEENLNYVEAMTILINYYLDLEEYNKAYRFLTNKDFTETCSSNIYLELEKLYLIGKLAAGDSSLLPESPSFYFNEAYKQMSDLNLNESSCKIMLELSKHYYERGNTNKAKEFALYGRSLINYLADQFIDERAKAIFLNSSYRKNAWEVFTEFINSE